MRISLQDIDVAILCGGLGKRLRELIGDKQKTFATLNGRPFLDIVLGSLKSQGVKRVVLLTGFQAKEVEAYYKKHNQGLKIFFSTEKEPLGTGGAVKNARRLIRSNPFFVLNGDCACSVNLASVIKFYKDTNALAVAVTSEVKDNEDYGGIVLEKDQRIQAFIEKGKNKDIKDVNAGIYCFDQRIFSRMPKKKQFSLEYDVFPYLIGNGFYGFKTKKKFYDIGTPERFRIASKKLR